MDSGLLGLPKDYGFGPSKRSTCSRPKWRSAQLSEPFTVNQLSDFRGRDTARPAHGMVRELQNRSCTGLARGDA